MKKVAIIGGGITGLTAAYRLQTLARQQDLALDITLIEQDNRLGGKIVTERRDGFVIEGGPDCFLARKPWAVALCAELNLSHRLQGTNQAHSQTYVMRGGRLHHLPKGLTGMIPTQFTPILKTSLLSPWGKARLGLDFLIPPKQSHADEAIAEFISRRLGSEIYHWLIEPLMGGIYAGDATQLSLQATFPQLRQVEQTHGSLIKGMLAARKKGATATNVHGPPVGGRTPSEAPDPNQSRSVFLTPQRGLSELVDAISTRLDGVSLCLQTSVRHIARLEQGYELIVTQSDRPATRACLQADLRSAKAHYDAILLTTPAYRAASLLQDLDPQLAQTLQAIPYVSSATLSLAYPASALSRPLGGYGYVIPRAENRPLLACTWTSTKFQNRAPEDYALLRTFIGRAGHQEVLQSSDEVLLALAQNELKQTLGIEAQPFFHSIYRWDQGMPQYNLGHLERVAQIETRLENYPGLYLAGAAYRGVGIPDCINMGEQKARAVLGYMVSK